MSAFSSDVLLAMMNSVYFWVYRICTRLPHLQLHYQKCRSWVPQSFSSAKPYEAAKQSLFAPQRHPENLLNSSYACHIPWHDASHCLYVISLPSKRLQGQHFKS
jgi:hypothetical protein